MQTCRQYWWNLNGRCRLNFNWDAIDHDSVVLISASEYRPNGGDPAHSSRFVGDARIRVLNVSPHSPPFDPNHGVTFVVDVDWDSPLHVVTDITVLDEKPLDTLWNGNLLAFMMQQQQQTNWCWAATATSVAHYYDVSSTWTQCQVANSQTGRNDCCGGGASTSCNTAQPLDTPLTIVGHLDHVIVAAETYDNIRSQIDFGRPLCLRVAWSGGNAHFLAAKGYDAHSGGQIVNVDDPIYGPSDVTYTTLATNYKGSGTWTHSYYTRP
jgi:Papain-like cysteine protease AvrRpt2